MAWNTALSFSLPDWTEGVAGVGDRFATDVEKMRLVVTLARENIRRKTGGPFGAAVFRRDTGALVSLGVNCVTAAKNSILHAEIVAIMAAERHLESHTLAVPGGPEHELVTSCEPCAMCLGAILWSGARRVVSGAVRDDALGLGFDEGPVFPASHRYLEDRGIVLVHGLLREEAAAVLREYRELGGEIY